MKYTFAVLTYNQGAIIVETLESIKYQILKYGKNYEIKLIIIDDNSKDNNVKIIDMWLEYNRKLFKSVEFIKNHENRGTVYNYNVILNKIGDENFKLIAGDDLIASINLFKENSLLDDNTISTYVRMKLEDGTISIEPKLIALYFYHMKHKKTQTYNLVSMRQGGYLHTPSTLYKKDLYLKAKCSSINRQFYLFEDDPTWYTMMKNINDLKLMFHEKGIVLYRVHNGSVSNTKVKTKVNEQFEVDMKNWRRICYEDTKGIERIFYWMRDRRYIPRFLRIEKYIKRFYFWYRILCVKNDIYYQKFLEKIERQVAREQIYYDDIKTVANKFYFNCIREEIDYASN